jgi:hypothetical protein
MPNISTSDVVKENLERIRDRDQHTSVDSVIRILLSKAGEELVAASEMKAI